MFLPGLETTLRGLRPVCSGWCISYCSCCRSLTIRPELGRRGDDVGRVSPLRCPWMKEKRTCSSDWLPGVSLALGVLVCLLVCVIRRQLHLWPSFDLHPQSHGVMGVLKYVASMERAIGDTLHRTMFDICHNSGAPQNILKFPCVYQRD